MPKSKEQFEQIKQERIKQIFHYALYLFALRDIDGVTTDEITRAAGCSHGLLYHYFGSKEELFQKVVTDVANKLEEEIIKNVDLSQKPKFALQDLLDAYLQALNSSRDDYACTIYLLTNLYIQSRKLPKNKQMKFKYSIFDSVFDIVEAGKESGSKTCGSESR